MIKRHDYDVLIIGSGCAGLALALTLDEKFNIGIVCKGDIQHSATYKAQGGIAAVVDEQDTIQAHIDDTLTTGAGLCDRHAVAFTVERGWECVEWLIDQGVTFSSQCKHHIHRDQANQWANVLHLGQEGGHSQRRIIHTGDATGQALVTTLQTNVLASVHISLLTECIAIDLLVRQGRCMGAYVLNKRNNAVEFFQANHVVLATGGASKAYLYTSNPDGATGDGIAMAWRAGCRIANMEFNQFHPTCLYHPRAKSFLITEAIRGEGGRLLLANGERFMHRFDPRAELAPRDIVARAIDHEMKRLGDDCVYLDITHQSADFLLHHFPQVKTKCLELGIDITREPIPVVPAAHYTCGGIVVDHHGRTDVAHLYAIGETSFTGLHGANRMASNSLLECIVYGRSAAFHIVQSSEKYTQYKHEIDYDYHSLANSDEEVVITHNWDELRRLMWSYVGIVRTNKRLQQALRRVLCLQQEVTAYYRQYRVTSDLLELRNLTMVAELIIRSALLRKESRGLHYTLDYPQLLSAAKDTILEPV